MKGTNMGGADELVELGRRRLVVVRPPLLGVVVAEAPEPPQRRLHPPFLAPPAIRLIDRARPLEADAALPRPINQSIKQSPLLSFRKRKLAVDLDFGSRCSPPLLLPPDRRLP